MKVSILQLIKMGKVMMLELMQSLKKKIKKKRRVRKRKMGQQ